MHSGAKIASLPSVCAMTLGKEGMFVECQCLDTRQRDQKLGLECPVFAECPGFDTRQTWFICRVSGPGHSANMHYLPSVRAGALGKQGHVCRVPRLLDTRQTRRGRLRTVTLLFLSSVGFSTQQRLCRVPDKKHSAKKRLPTLCMPSAVCRV